MDEQTPPTPPGKVRLSAKFGNWALTMDAVLSSDDTPSKHRVFFSIRPHDEAGHYDVHCYDGRTQQRIDLTTPGLEVLVAFAQAHFIEVVGQFVDQTTDPGFSLHLAAEGPPPSWVPLDPEPGEGRVN